MSRSYDFLITALKSLPEKPPDDAPQSSKKAYSERMSAVVASAFAEELRQRGLIGTRPSSPGEEAGISGAERRMSGGIGAKKVDVTWSTEQSGLQLALSVKCINFKDRRGRNYQKNVVNRRGDMLFESVTLHRRFPYAVLGGFMLLDVERLRTPPIDVPRLSSTPTGDSDYSPAAATLPGDMNNTSVCTSRLSTPHRSALQRNCFERATASTMCNWTMPLMNY